MKTRQRFKINKPAVVSEVLDGEAVIIHLDKGAYYSFDKEGGEIWGLIERKASVEEIIASILSRCEGDEQQIRSEVVRLVEELHQEELIVPELDASEPLERTVTAERERIPFEVPTLSKFTDMQDFLMVDPIHEVDESGWPNKPSEPSVN